MDGSITLITICAALIGFMLPSCGKKKEKTKTSIKRYDQRVKKTGLKPKKKKKHKEHRHGGFLFRK